MFTSREESSSSEELPFFFTLQSLFFHFYCILSFLVLSNIFIPKTSVSSRWNPSGIHWRLESSAVELLPSLSQYGRR